MYILPSTQRIHPITTWNSQFYSKLISIGRKSIISPEENRYSSLVVKIVHWQHSQVISEISIEIYSSAMVDVLNKVGCSTYTSWRTGKAIVGRINTPTLTDFFCLRDRLQLHKLLHTLQNFRRQSDLPVHPETRTVDPSTTGCVVVDTKLNARTNVIWASICSNPKSGAASCSAPLPSSANSFTAFDTVPWNLPTRSFTSWENWNESSTVTIGIRH